MRREEVGEFLRQHVPLFSDFDDERLTQVVAGSRVDSYEPLQAIVEFGEESRFFGVLLEGEATHSVVSDAGDRQLLGRLHPGETFGEMALMSGEKTMADLIAETRCQVLLVPLTLVSSCITSDTRAMRHVSRTVSQRFMQLAEDPARAAAAFRKSSDPYDLALRSERPETILVINCGSSSLKYCVYDTVDDQRDARGTIERIGVTGTRHSYRSARGEVTTDLPTAGFHEAFQEMLRQLTHPDSGVLGDPARITVVAHRVVHGGERFTAAVVIDEAVLREIASLGPLAPLHNPVNVAGIKEAQRLLPSVPHVAVFDTAFHHTIPSYAYLYGLPYEYYERSGLRRYGFHGMSHSYVCLRAAEYLKRRFNELEIISCHLGNGASVCAVDHGRSVDTSMGFTPAEGLIMGTRCGDVDPAAITYLQRTEGLSAGQIDEIITKKSGLFGLSGLSGDMREIERAADQGEHRALLALKVFSYRVRKYIGAYVAAMGGLDAIVFTGGIGQGSAGVRSLALQGLNVMGIRFDEQRNRDARGFEEICRISADDSPIAVLVVPTDEERMIARETLQALSRSYLTRVLEAHREEPIPIEVSAHHVHLTQEHVETLFGPGHQLTAEAPLSQPGQFACQEKVALVGPKGRVERVRVLGPVRKTSQVEIAMTEQYKLGIHPPIRESGDVQNTPGVTLEGPAGTLQLDKGVICALRHIHMTPENALRYGVRDKSTVTVRVAGDRELTFGDVRVRVSPNFQLAMHIDTDEANAGNVQTGAEGYIEAIQSRD